MSRRLGRSIWLQTVTLTPCFSPKHPLELLRVRVQKPRSYSQLIFMLPELATVTRAHVNAATAMVDILTKNIVLMLLFWDEPDCRVFWTFGWHYMSNVATFYVYCLLFFNVWGYSRLDCTGTGWIFIWSLRNPRMVTWIRKRTLSLHQHRGEWNICFFDLSLECMSPSNLHGSLLNTCMQSPFLLQC